MTKHPRAAKLILGGDVLEDSTGGASQEVVDEAEGGDAAAPVPQHPPASLTVT